LSAEVISKSTQPKLPDHSVRAIGRLVAADGRELPICLDQRSTIGRHHASDHAIVDDVFVSTTHGVLTAFVTSAEDSLCILEDQSLNGTYVNGEHVHRRSVVLLEGDVIAIGLATFTFRQLAPTSQRFSALSVGGQQVRA
jgi:pSer/pThr/pTyr-binding forkhead associated (FHA) protein